MQKLSSFALKFYLLLERNLRNKLSDEDGTLKDFTWVVGAAVVTALIIVGAMVYAPQTAQNFWNAATNWIRGKFGF